MPGLTRLLLPVCPALLAAAPLHLETRVIRIEGGPVVVLHEDRRAPRVLVHALLHAGVADEGPGRSGLAHLAEHLFVEGGVPGQEGASFLEILAPVGGDLNAWTDFDATAFHWTLPSGELDRALALLAGRLGAPAGGLETGMLEREKAVLRAEILQRAEAPHARDALALALALWPEGHPYARALAGDPDELPSLGQETLADFYARHYAPSRFSVVVTGDLDLDTTERALRLRLADLPRPEAAPLSDVPVTPLVTEQRRVFRAPVPDPTLYAAWRTVPWGHPDEPALDAVARLLSSGPGSRLHERLRRRGLADRVQAWTDNGRSGGMLTVGLSSTSTSLPRLLRILDATLRELGESGPGEPELARFRGAMRGSLLRRVEPLLGRAEAFNACMLRWDRPDCMDEELRRWESVDADAVRRVLEVHLRPDRRVLLSVVPEGDGGALPGSVPLEAPLSVDAGYFASSTAMASMSR